MARELRRIGFQRGVYNPCLYYHQERNLRTFLHGDDFATVGTRSEVKWFRNCLEKMFEIKTQIIGVPEESREARKGTDTPSGSAPTLKNGEPWLEGTDGETAQ